MANETILVVDDEQICLDVLDFILTTKGYKVEKARDGAEALQYLKDNNKNPNLIMLDIMMPIMDGVEFLENMMKDSDINDIPVIVQTGAGEDGSIERAMGLGAAEFIRKPYNRDSIIKLVNETLTSHTA